MLQNHADHLFSLDKSIDLIGKKAYYLYKMQEAGLPVPPFFILSTVLIKEILDDLQDEIEGLERDAAYGIIQVQDCTALQSKIENLVIPEYLQERVINQCFALFGDSFQASIRSSATLEDGNKSSFAGQFKSYLHISKNELWASIKGCIASSWSYDVFTYRKTQGLLGFPLQMAVIIQNMIVAERSGVAFSMNVQGNYGETLIVAGYGLGEGIVSDRAESDMFYVDRQNKTIFSELTLKRSKTIQLTGSKLSDEKLSSNEGTNPALTQEEVFAVFELSVKAEEIIQAPADLEFSFDGSGKLFALQIRPITAIQPERLIILDNTNIIESYPGISLPLSYSFAQKAYDAVFRQSASSFWLSKREFKDLDNVFSHLLHHFNGRIYYRMDNWFRMLGRVYKSKSSYEDWAKAVGFKDDQFKWNPSNWYDKFKLYLASAFMLLSQARNVKLFYHYFNTSYQAFRSLEKIIDNFHLWEHFEKYQGAMLKHWHHTISNDFLAFKYFGLLKNSLNNIGMEANPNLANDLVANRYTNSSELAIISLLKIKARILSKNEYAELFAQSNEEIQRALQTKSFLELNDSINKHIDEFADRMLSELKLENPSFRQNKAGFLDLLKKQLDSSTNLDTYLLRKKSIYNKARRELNHAFRKVNIIKRCYILWLLKKSAKGIRNRENMRFCRAKGYGLVREIFYKIADNLVRNGYIEESKDLFYLSIQELEEFCTSRDPEDLWNILEKRKETYNAYFEMTLPGRIIFDPDHPPHFSSSRALEHRGTLLSGLSVSSGIVKAEVIVISQPSYEINVKNKIIVTHMTDPGWVFLMSQAAGIISEKGSILSHTAIVGRELGLPVIVGVENATQLLKTGQIVTLDADRGIVLLDE